MKMNRTAAVMAAGMIAVSAMSVSAAGIGYVNTNALVGSHPKMQKAQLDLQTAAKKAQDDFNKQSEGKSDEDKQKIGADLQRGLAQKEASLMQPILDDVKKAIQAVRKEKNLDIVLDGASVVDGGVDVTPDVSAKIGK